MNRDILFDTCVVVFDSWWVMIGSCLVLVDSRFIKRAREHPWTQKNLAFLYIQIFYNSRE